MPRNKPDTGTEPITAFMGKYEFLSNFHGTSVTFYGKSHWTLEHAFQAAKTYTPEERDQIRQNTDPRVAKREGQKVTLRADWEQVKDAIMLELVRNKFSWSIHPRIAQKLVATGERPLLEGNTWGDVYWGVNATTLKGRNQLGITLMQRREELLEEETALGLYLQSSKLTT